MSLALGVLIGLLAAISGSAIRRLLARTRGVLSPAPAGAAATAVPGGAPADPPAQDEVIAVERAHGGDRHLLARRAILFLEAHGDYVRVHADDGKRYLLHGSLTALAERWEPFGFVRVHRQYVANLHRAAELRPLPNGTAELLFEDGDAIVPVARRHVAELRRRLSA